MKSAAQRRPIRYTQHPMLTSIAPNTVTCRFFPAGNLRADRAQRPARPDMRQQLHVRLVLGQHHCPARELDQPGHDPGDHVLMVLVLS
jgi:hypothetical protein